MDDQPLETFIENLVGDSHLRVEQDFGGGYVRLKTSEAQRRQAVQDIRSSEDILIELLRNSRDAGATHIFVATAKEGDRRSLVVLDDGSGIPAAMHEHVFEPRVTSKLETAHLDKWGMHGRGMALYSISVNSESAAVAASQPGMGTALRVVTDTTKLGEKADQSTFPLFEKQESGTFSMRGPKNLLRTAAEFALEHRGQVTVFLGSPAEIAATVYAFALAHTTPSQRAFEGGEGRPLAMRPAFCSDPAALADCATGFGMDISERTARRIFDGDLEPVPHLLLRLQEESFAPKQKRERRSSAVRDGRRLKVEEEDLALLSCSVEAAYRSLAERYFLAPDVAPDISVGREAITITIPIEKLL